MAETGDPTLTFWDLPPEQCQQLLSLTWPASFRADNAVSTPERPLRGIHFIVSGEVRLSDDHHLDIARSGMVLDRGDSFGEYSVVGARPFPSRIDTLTDLRTQFLPVEHFPAAADKIPGLRRLVRRRARLGRYLPRLLRTLRRHDRLSPMAVHQLSAMAWEGALDLLQPGEAPGPAWFLYVARGELACRGHCKLRTGTLIDPGDQDGLTATGKTWVVRITRETCVRHAQRTFSVARAMPALQVAPRPVLVLGNIAGLPLSALTNLLADTLQRELPRTDAAHRVAVVTSAAADGQGTRQAAERMGVLYRQVALDGPAILQAVAELTAARAFPVLLDLPELSRVDDAQVRPLARQLSAAISKIVFLRPPIRRHPGPDFADVPVIPAVPLVPGLPVRCRTQLSPGHHPPVLAARRPGEPDTG